MGFPLSPTSTRSPLLLPLWPPMLLLPWPPMLLLLLPMLLLLLPMLLLPWPLIMLPLLPMLLLMLLPLPPMPLAMPDTDMPLPLPLMLLIKCNTQLKVEVVNMQKPTCKTSSTDKSDKFYPQSDHIGHYMSVCVYIDSLSSTVMQRLFIDLRNKS